MKYVILNMLLLVNFLLQSCASNCCINKNEFESLPGLNVYNDILHFKGDTTELNIFIIDQIKRIDSTDWKHSLVYLKIADELEEKGVLHETAQALRYKVMRRYVKEIYLALINEEVISEEMAAKFYLLSYANFSYANTMYKSGDKEQAMSYYNFAYQLSPDRIPEYSCKNIMEYLNGKPEYRSIYAEKLEETKDFKKAWNIWFELANENDAYINNLKLLHSRFYPDENFDIFWKNNRFAHFPHIANFDFLDAAGDTISFYSVSENWTLIDFWSPQLPGYVKEFPQLEKFNFEVTAKGPANNKVMAICMYADRSEIRKAVGANNYNFVIGAIVNMNAVIASGLPIRETHRSKIIVTPGKNYFAIPTLFWKKYAEKYLLDEK